VAIGSAITVDPVVIDKPVDGLHIYVFAPDAVRVTLFPLHIAGGVGIVIVGSGFTVILLFTVRVQPLPFVIE
jgi:hypothetical protein